jgi:exonuclease III
MRFGTWNVRSLYTSSSLTAVDRELARCKLYLVGVQEVKSEKGSMVRPEDYNFFHGKGKKNHQLETGYCVYHRYYQRLRQ